MTGMDAASASWRPWDVVDVDDTHGRPIRGEEAGLGGEVALDGAVEIEVVAFQVREDGDRESRKPSTR